MKVPRKSAAGEWHVQGPVVELSLAHSRNSKVNVPKTSRAMEDWQVMSLETGAVGRFCRALQAPGRSLDLIVELFSS